MNKEKPPKKEILEEIVKEACSVSKEALKELSSWFAHGAGLSLITPYVIPTAICSFAESPERPLYENEFQRKTHDFFGGLGFCAGVYAGLAIDLLQYLAFKGNPEYTIPLLLTNVASGAFEFYNRVYKKAEEKVSSKNLNN